jgi:hypothetical protein
VRARKLEPEPTGLHPNILDRSVTTSTLAELYILVDALAFIESIGDDNPARTLAWIFSKLERSRSYRRDCEIDEWEAQSQLGDEEVHCCWLRPKYVLSA